MESKITKRALVCECTSSARVTADIVRLEFFWPGPAPCAGQFFLIKPRRSTVFLARPISVAGWKHRRQAAAKGDADKRRVESGGHLSFLVAVKGRGSQEITEMRPGEEAELSGPLGNCWPVELVPKSPVALIAGGIGIAPLLALASELGRKSDESGEHVDGSDDPADESKKIVFDFYAGFKSGSFGLEKVKARSLIISTEDGSEGKKGRITEFFRPSGCRGVFACGPEPMLRTIASICRIRGIPCFISVERHMACGVGACLGCTVKSSDRETDRNYRCCADGPVFNAEEIAFDV